MIEAYKKLSVDKMQQFRSASKVDDALLIQVTHVDGVFEEFTFDMSDEGLYNAFNFQNNSTHAISNDDDVYFATENEILHISGLDVVWYQKRRFKKFVVESAPGYVTTEKPTKTSKSKSDEQFIVNTALKVDDTVVELDSFTGTRKELVTILNKQQMLMRIRYPETTALFCIRNTTDSSVEYHTIEELIAMEVLK